MQVKLFNMKRVDETASFIADELEKLLDRNNFDSHFSKRLTACPAYKNGLTLGEELLAILRALSKVQLTLTADLASMERTKCSLCDDDDEGAARLVSPEEVMERIRRKERDGKENA